MYRDTHIAAHRTIHVTMVSLPLSLRPVCSWICSLNTRVYSLTMRTACSAAPFDCDSFLADVSGTTMPPWYPPNASRNAMMASSPSLFKIRRCLAPP